MLKRYSGSTVYAIGVGNKRKKEAHLRTMEHLHSAQVSVKVSPVWVHKSSHAFQTPFLDGMVNQAYCTLILPSSMSNIKLLPQRSVTIFLSPEEINNDADCTLILFHLQLEEFTTRWMDNYDRHSQTACSIAGTD